MMNPMTLSAMIDQRIDSERKGPYKAVYEGIEKLDVEFPVVARNQSKLDEGTEAIEYAIANLLFSAHAAHAYPNKPSFSRVDAHRTTLLLCQVGGGRSMLMDFLFQIFPQAVFCTEHFFFLNRQIERLMSLPDEQRPAPMRGQRVEDWAFPMDRVEKLRVAAVDLWKAQEDKKHAYEAR